jgi:hypothetical protein
MALYVIYTSIDIQYKYNGIKYQAGNIESAEVVSIEIKGKYVREWFGKPKLFEGQIIVNQRELILVISMVG